tara:strand:- start:72 stop:515 length:444 start_codon:yes stop_codon:yes gene_type:complete
VIRAELLYDQLKGRRTLTNLQHRLIYLVHARKMRMDLLKIRIFAAAGSNEHNQQFLADLVDQYTEIQFPGLEHSTDPSSFEEVAKKALAEEIKKVYRVKRIMDPKAKEKELAKITGAGSAGGAIAAKATLEEQQAIRDLRRLRGRKK